MGPQNADFVWLKPRSIPPWTPPISGLATNRSNVESCRTFFTFGSCSQTPKIIRKKYTSGPRYWNISVLVNTGTFLVYQYCLKM